MVARPDLPSPGQRLSEVQVECLS